MANVDASVIGKSYSDDNQVDNIELIKVNEKIRNHPIEKVGKRLRGAMTAMKALELE